MNRVRYIIWRIFGKSRPNYGTYRGWYGEEVFPQYERDGHFHYNTKTKDWDAHFEKGYGHVSKNKDQSFRWTFHAFDTWPDQLATHSGSEPTWEEACMMSAKYAKMYRNL